MDDQRRRPDPTSRPDPYELAIQRAETEPGPEAEDGTPPLPRLQAGPFRVGPTGLLLGVLLLVGVGTLVRFGADRTPALAPSCTAYGVALASERVRPGGLVVFTVVGRPGEVRLVVDPRAAGARAQELPGVTVPGSCRTTGRFGAQVPPGEHDVRLLVDGRPAAAADLTVTEPGDPDVD